MIGTKLVMNGTWKQPGVYNLEELDPDPFMEALNEYGLPWVVVENPQMVDSFVRIPLTLMAKKLFQSNF